MIALVFEDDSFVIVKEDKTEFKVQSLLKNKVKTIFAYHRKKDIERFMEVISDKSQYEE